MSRNTVKGIILSVIPQKEITDMFDKIIEEDMTWKQHAKCYKDLWEKYKNDFLPCFEKGAFLLGISNMYLDYELEFVDEALVNVPANPYKN